MKDWLNAALRIALCILVSWLLYRVFGRVDGPLSPHSTVGALALLGAGTFVLVCVMEGTENGIETSEMDVEVLCMVAAMAGVACAFVWGIGAVTAWQLPWDAAAGIRLGNALTFGTITPLFEILNAFGTF